MRLVFEHDQSYVLHPNVWEPCWEWLQDGTAGTACLVDLVVSFHPCIHIRFLHEFKMSDSDPEKTHDYGYGNEKGFQGPGYDHGQGHVLVTEDHGSESELQHLVCRLLPEDPQAYSLGICFPVL